MFNIPNKFRQKYIALIELPNIKLFHFKKQTSNVFRLIYILLNNALQCAMYLICLTFMKKHKNRKI